MIQTIVTYCCPNRDSRELVRGGHDYKGNQKYHCKVCGSYRTRQFERLPAVGTGTGEARATHLHIPQVRQTHTRLRSSKSVCSQDSSVSSWETIVGSGYMVNIRTSVTIKRFICRLPIASASFTPLYRPPDIAAQLPLCCFIAIRGERIMTSCLA